MGEQRARIQAWLEQRNRARDREDGAWILAIAEICDDAIEKGKLTAKQVRALIDALKNTHAMVWGTTAELIFVLQQNGVDVAPVLLELIKSKKVHDRYAAISCLYSTAPRALADKLLIAGLTDKNIKVRWIATQTAIVSFRKRWLAPLIAPAGACLRFNIPNCQTLIRQGYVLNKVENGTYNLTVLPIWACGPMTHSYSEAELNSKGIDALVYEMQHDKSYMGHYPVELQVEEHQIVDEEK